MNDTISFSDFQKLDIRIGTVVEATVPEWGHGVMKLRVDLGPEIGERIIFAGIMKFYKPEDIANQQFPFIINLPPKKIGPKELDGTQGFSEAMMLMAVKGDMGQSEIHEDDIEPVLFTLRKPVPNGTTVR